MFSILYSMMVSVGAMPFNPYLLGFAFVVDFFTVGTIVANLGGKNE